MRGTADGGGFLGRDAAESEVVELKGEKCRIAGANKSFANDLFDRAGKCGDGDGIPDLQENGFGPVGEPIEFRVGVLDGNEGVVAFDYCAFLHRADAERQAPAVFGKKRFEALVIKSFRTAGEMRVSDAAGFLYVVGGEDLSGKIGFDDVLQHGEHSLVEHAAAGFDVRIDVPRVRGILPPVGELVGVRVEDGIQPKRLHGAPCGCTGGWVGGRKPLATFSIAKAGDNWSNRTLPVTDGRTTKLVVTKPIDFATFVT